MYGKEAKWKKFHAISPLVVNCFLVGGSVVTEVVMVVVIGVVVVVVVVVVV